MQGQRENVRDSHDSLLIVGGLISVLVMLGGLMVASPSGLFGFLQSVGEANVLSLSILVSVIGVVFILLHRMGMSFGAAEKIERDSDLSLA